MKRTFTITPGDEACPEHMTYWLENEAGTPFEVCSVGIDTAIPRPAAIKLAKQELIDRAQYVLLRESESGRLGVEDEEL